MISKKFLSNLIASLKEEFEFTQIYNYGVTNEQNKSKLNLQVDQGEKSIDLDLWLTGYYLDFQILEEVIKELKLQ